MELFDVFHLLVLYLRLLLLNNLTKISGLFANLIWLHLHSEHLVLQPSLLWIHK